MTAKFFKVKVACFLQEHIFSYNLTSWYLSEGAGWWPAAASQKWGCGRGGRCVEAVSASWLPGCSTPERTSAPAERHDATLHIQFQDETNAAGAFIFIPTIDS